jgi:RNA polymerase sigma-70 factor (ECF subfamily)
LPTEDAITGSNRISTVTEDVGPLARTSPVEVDRSEDAVLVARLRAGDESAFTHVVDAWSPTMLRLARTFVSTDASAQEIVQETWLAVVRGLDRFEGRSSVRTWVFRILSNLGKTRGVREARSVPMSSLSRADTEGPTVDPSRFRGADDEWSNGWTLVGSPRAWSPSPEDAALAGEVRRQVATALQELPERQRTVVSLRDVHGMSADEVCVTLAISPANQRVLLHRGRARLRETLENYYRGLTPVMSS